MRKDPLFPLVQGCLESTVCVSKEESHFRDNDAHPRCPCSTPVPHPYRNTLNPSPDQAEQCQNVSGFGYCKSC